MKKLIESTLLFLLLGCSAAFAQKWEPPKEYALKADEDFTKYEEDAMSAINWLTRTPYDQDTLKRKEVSKFLLDWISGHPKITIEINPDIVNFTENNPELLLIFMAGWAKYAIQNPDDMNNIKGNHAGIRAAIAYYDKNEGLNREKNLEKYAKMQDKGELRKWLTDQLKN